ncbi:hypothetical protein MPTK1_3g23250 [Marchantia polymorpha subsp. ruderalis]|uniref:Uncharacterized protein n=2 Tax=Marchantia polymorpha TaxID=3197 RepID=A0AAF6B3W5_MARPO|nr:hypothetical protein MARPO_0024s0102 [Marchantia polymorpha]BBN06699.1 hypothetical protein Mp_3g23250 [Marchantia polymorpha subsp. ruderalis]|eukprot:PTQ43599.1 hypothetical protein MARPO_0024s0102 [Marchantia polymorpha]
MLLEQERGGNRTHRAPSHGTSRPLSTPRRLSSAASVGRLDGDRAAFRELFSSTTVVMHRGVRGDTSDHASHAQLDGSIHPTCSSPCRTRTSSRTTMATGSGSDRGAWGPFPCLGHGKGREDRSGAAGTGRGRFRSGKRDSNSERQMDFSGDVI